MSATPIDKLIDSIESSLADLTAMPDKLEAIGRILGAIEQGVADHAAAVSGQSLDLGPLVQAIRALKPSVTVVVPPQEPLPAPIFQLPDMKGATWEIRMPGAYGGPDRVAILKRTA